MTLRTDKIVGWEALRTSLKQNLPKQEMCHESHGDG
jgi:hypothetical protein